LVDEHFAAGLDGLVGALGDEQDVLEARHIDDFMRFTNELDAGRDQNIRTALAELFALWHAERGWHEPRAA
jgi:hypothetical protein